MLLYQHQSRFQILFFHSFVSIPVPIVTGSRGNSFVILAEARDWKQLQLSSWPGLIWAGHQRAHIKELQHFKSAVLTFMASVYARSCTLTYTFPFCEVEGTHVSDGNVSCLVDSRGLQLGYRCPTFPLFYCFSLLILQNFLMLM